MHTKLVHLCLTLGSPMDSTCQVPLSMGFSRQECWTGFPCIPPGDLPDPGIEPASLMCPALAGDFFTTSTTWEAFLYNRGGKIFCKGYYLHQDTVIHHIEEIIIIKRLYSGCFWTSVLIVEGTARF